MGCRVEFSDLAEKDLERAVRYLARKNQEAAIRIGDELVNVALSLSNLPHRGVPVRSRKGLRKVPHRHYLLFYRVDEDRSLVRIVRIWDNRRDPEALRFG